MEENTINIDNEKNEYLFKIIYLIRINLPSSEFIYIIMFFLKYIGIITFGLSLNQMKKEINTPSPNEKDSNDKNDNNLLNSNDSIDNVHSFFSKLLINGNNLKILNNKYQIICIIGFCVLLIYIIIFIFGFFYMRNKYYNKTLITNIEKKIKIINNNADFEKKLFKYISYTFFLIVFFHQYIIEYYIFGFIGYIFNIFHFFETFTSENYNSYYYTNLDNHLKSLTINPVVNIVINAVTIIIVLIFFIIFLLINSTKTLFIKNGIPLYANNKYILMKFIIFNYNSLYGMANIFGNQLKIRIIIIIIVTILISILMDIILSFYTFSFYPSNLNYVCVFIEFFVLFSIITEIIIYLIDTDMNLDEYNLFIRIIILINAIIFNCLFIYKKNNNNLMLFSDNLFSNSFKEINPTDIYYYIETYLEYYEDRENNYLKLFKLIQNHILKCDKKECPGHILIPKSISLSPYTNFSLKYNPLSQNEHKNNIIFTNEENNELDNINYKNLSDNPRENKKNSVEQSRLSSSFKSNKEINSNLSFFVNAIEKRKSILERKNTERIGSISLFSSSNKPSLSKNTMRPSKMKIGKENNLKINVNKDDDENNINIIEEKEDEKLNNEQFIMIGEQEIINRINYLYKTKKYDFLQDYIFIHLQYLLKIKQNFRLALFFVGRYSLSNIKFSFLSRYYLYEIKKYIRNNFINSKTSNAIKDQYIINYKEDNIFMQKFVNYIMLYLMIKKLLKISCEKIIYFYSFKAGLHNSLSLQKYSKSKIYPVIQSAEDIQTSISKLKFLIKEYYREVKIPIESIELSYLISNFIKLINGKISQDILRYISPILYFKDSLYEKLSNEFHQYTMQNPLIINLTQKDTFNITYFTNNILDRLGYSYTDLKNKDFHEKLFPGATELIKEHCLIMKEFLFFYKNTFSKEKTFLKSKEGFLISINFTCKIFPNFNEDFFLIINIIFNDDSTNNFPHKSIEHNKKTNNFNGSNEKVNIYSFILDYHFEFFSMTKNFYLEYDLNQNLFRELRINFCQFFCINENKLNEKIKKEKKKILRKYPKCIHKISLRESNRIFTTFQNIKIENTFKLRNEKLLENYFVPSITIYDKIDKKKLVHKIPEIINLIDEIGLDYDWYIRLQNFKERLIANGHFQNIKETGISSTTNYNQPIGGDNRRSTIVEQNILEYNLKNPEHFFKVAYSIRKLGSISFYIVNLKEKICNSSEEVHLTCEIQENININTAFNKRHSSANLILSKKFRKINSPQSIKYNNLVSGPSKSNEEENTDEHGFNRKAKTKAFFPLISGIINNSLRAKENIKKDEKINKMNSLNNAEINKEAILGKMKENANTINNIKKNSNEFSKNSKSLKEINNKDNIKMNKISKKEKYDEDESTELIPKDKFHEILKNLNKKNRIILMIISILIVTCLLLIISKFTVCMIGFEQSQTLLRAIIYLDMIKVDLYSLSILSMIHCINEKYNIRLSDFQSNKIIGNIKILEHLKLYEESFNSIINNKNCLGISKILNKKFFIYTLNIDWNVYRSETSILKEIRGLSFKKYELLNNDETCNTTLFRYIRENETIEISEIKANVMEKLFYYFIRNSLDGYRNIFNDLKVESANTIEKMFSTYQKTLFCFFICIIILLVVFVIFYVIKACYDYSYYQLLFLYYYHIENEQLHFENQIYYLYKTIQEFNSDNIYSFEYSKTAVNYKYANDNINNNSSYKNNNSNFNINKNNFRNSLKKKNNKRSSSSSLKNSIDVDKNNISLLNASINGSSLQLLNNINHHKMLLNNNFSNKNSRMSISEKEEKEESIDSVLKTSNKILPNSIKISLIFIIVGVIIYITIGCGNIIESKKEKNIRSFSINLSMNILERVPRLMGLLIYSLITIITDNFIKIEGPLNENQPSYLTYFKANSLYYSEDIMNKYFKNNFFGELLKDTLRVNYNFNNYLFQDTEDIFTSTKYYETLLNTKGYFCIYASVGNILHNYDNYEVYDFMEYMNSYTIDCKELDLGIDESGIKLEINYILQELTNKYIEFITYNNSNITIEQAKDRFLGSSDIKRISLDMQYPLILYYNTIIYAIYYDFENQGKSFINTQILFDSFLLLCNLLIIICLLYVVTKGEKYKSLFAYFLEIPKINKT